MVDWLEALEGFVREFTRIEAERRAEKARRREILEERAWRERLAEEAEERAIEREKRQWGYRRWLAQQQQKHEIEMAKIRRPVAVTPFERILKDIPEERTITEPRTGMLVTVPTTIEERYHEAARILLGRAPTAEEIRYLVAGMYGVPPVEVPRPVELPPPVEAPRPVETDVQRLNRLRRELEEGRDLSQEDIEWLRRMAGYGR